MALVDFSLIVSDNEKTVRAALDRGDYVQAFLLVHVLIESLLRTFLRTADSNATFAELIQEYKRFLEQQSPGIAIFIEELTLFNRRRNRIVHELWRKGYTYTNRQAKDAAGTAVIMYGLFIEFLQTFDPESEEKGYQYDEGS